MYLREPVQYVHHHYDYTQLTKSQNGFDFTLRFKAVQPNFAVRIAWNFVFKIDGNQTGMEKNEKKRKKLRFPSSSMENCKVNYKNHTLGQFLAPSKWALEACSQCMIKSTQCIRKKTSSASSSSAPHTIKSFSYGQSPSSQIFSMFGSKLELQSTSCARRFFTFFRRERIGITTQYRVRQCPSVFVHTAYSNSPAWVASFDVTSSIMQFLPCTFNERAYMKQAASSLRHFKNMKYIKNQWKEMRFKKWRVWEIATIR